VTPLAESLRDEILRYGSLPFRRFMEAALYHPEHGYYRRARDPFGKCGDFYTAEQVQPVFGILVAGVVRALWREMGEPAGFAVVELGAGRGEMAEAFSAWRYVPVDLAAGVLPASFRGVLFINEFFDALPVDVAVFTGGAFHERRVAWSADAFTWMTGEAAPPEVEEYCRRFFPPPEEGRVYEANLAALIWMERIAAALATGFVLTIDYGYTRTEARRFPQGTLMSYHRHTALEDVLAAPGERDLTAHVNFTALQEHGTAHHLKTVRFETLARTLLAAGEADQFAAALAAATPAEETRRRLQLKTLLFGMGETFRTLVQEKAPK
jgi:SAM-dependent MidA family methyltransferase